MKVEEYQERTVAAFGWEVRMASYRLGAEWHARADNVSPGATLTRAAGATREEAEAKALERAEDLLERTRRHAV